MTQPTLDLADAQLRATCEREELAVETVAGEVANGHLVFLRSSASRSMPDFVPTLVGSVAAKKVAALIGLGPRDRDRAAIVDTMQVILAARPDAVMDLTTNPEGVALRRELKDVVQVPLGACLTYDLLTSGHLMSRSEFLEQFEAGLTMGVDFVLVHMGMSWPLIEAMKKSRRTMPTTSRGGGLVSRYMQRHNAENPLVEHLDGMLELCRKYEVVLDLGDIFRPGCLEDAGDDLKLMEIELIAEQRRRALAAGVQVLCEAGGHMPLDQIPHLISTYKEMLGGAPLWLAGPMPVDIAVTQDGLVNALGVLTAAQHGGDMFASITDNEHYAMPTAPDTAAAVRSVRVTIAAVEVGRGRPSALRQNREMGRARRLNSWETQARHALYPDLANQVFIQNDLLRDGKPCTICGQFCPHVIVKKEQEIELDPAVSAD